MTLCSLALAVIISLNGALTPPKAEAAVSVDSTSTWRVARIVPWYGYGFYGNRTACGQRLTRTIVGVASRTLKCGTKVKFLWKHITITVPVIDRGPYPRRSLYDDMPFDLTAGAARLFKRYAGENPYFTRYNVKYKILR